MYAPVTTGSEHDPLPIGEWKVTGVQKNPTFHYNPDLFWDADRGHAKAKIPAGPNNPVGVVWVDISRPHYGLHGTPEPSTVGKTSSHGCVRLTNWDAQKLAALVQARHEGGVRRISPWLRRLTAPSGLQVSRRQRAARLRPGRVRGGVARATCRPAAPGRAATAVAASTPLAPLAEPVKAPAATAVDEPPNAVVEVPAPTSGRTGVIPPTAPEAMDLTARRLTDSGAGRPAGQAGAVVSRRPERRDASTKRSTSWRRATLPVVAVEDGTIAKLFFSKAGGLTIYQFDPGQRVLLLLRPPGPLCRRPQGGGPGPAGGRSWAMSALRAMPQKTRPIYTLRSIRLTAEKHWWEGTPIDPYDILR